MEQKTEQKNPHLTALAGISLTLMGIGLVVLIVANASTSPYEPSIGDGQIIGAILMGFGAWIGVVWLAIKAIRWKG